jgi:hypothetical protein
MCHLHFAALARQMSIDFPQKDGVADTLRYLCEFPDLPEVDQEGLPDVLGGFTVCRFGQDEDILWSDVLVHIVVGVHKVEG